MNLEFTKRVRDYIAAQPDTSVDMDIWLDNGDSISVCDIVVYTENQYLCGTVGCIAGYTTLVDREATKRAFYKLNNGLVEVGFPEVAASLLGIGGATSSNLFRKVRWPMKYANMTDKEGILAILDRAIAEESFEFICEL